MDLIYFLKQDHAVIKELLDKISNIKGAALTTRKSQFKKLKNALKFHTEIEEKLFYTTLKKAKETRDLVFEAYEEHHLVDHLISQIEKSSNPDIWKAKFTVLKENVVHHIKEEESQLFPKAYGVLSLSQLDELGRKMNEMQKKQKKSRTATRKT